MATVLTPSTELDEKQEFVSVADFRQHLSEMLNQAYYLKQTYIITRHKKPVVAMIPLFDEAMVDRLDLFLANETVRVSLEKEKAGDKNLTQEEMAAELGIKYVLLPTYSDHARALLTQIENRYPDDGKQLMATYSSCFLGNISDSALPRFAHQSCQTENA